MTLRTKLITAFSVAVTVRLVFHLSIGFIADDAFITFRYAQNLAAGLGFVYNPGVQVLGTSTPFFTWLLAVLALCRLPVIGGALLLSLVASGLTAAVLYRYATYLRFGRLAWLPVLVYALWPRSVPVDVCGMETALFTLLVTAALYFRHRRQDYYAIGLATLATLTRPEGGLLLLLVLAGCCRANRHLWKSYLATSAVLLLPWLTFAQFYFGSALPNSIPAKLALYSQFGVASWWDNLVYLMAWHNPVGWLLTVAAIGGAYWLFQKQNGGWLETIWLLTTVCFFTFSRTHLFFWYVVPLYPIFILLATAAVVWVHNRYPDWRKYEQVITASLGVAITIVLGVGLYFQAIHYERERTYADTVLKQAGLYLAAQVDLETELVAAEDIGHVGFYSRCRILDRDGLVSPEAIPYNRDARYFDLIQDARPTWIGVTVGSPISNFVNDGAFSNLYAPVKTFGSPKLGQYQIYRRVDQPIE